MEGAPKVNKAEFGSEALKTPEQLVAEARALYKSLQTYNGETLSGKEAEKAEAMAKNLSQVLGSLPYLVKVEQGLPNHPTDLRNEPANLAQSPIKTAA